MKFIKEWGFFILFIAILILLRIFVWEAVIVEGHSMDPTLANKERLIIVKTASIKRQDIVVAKEYNDAAKQSKNIVKRVIGMPGDTISFDNDVLTVNGKVISEPYLNTYQSAFAKDKLDKTYQYSAYFQGLAKNASAFTQSSTGQINFTVKVPEGQYFLMGDNRLVSQDSRIVGAFSKKDIIGTAKLRIWPLKKIGLL